MFELARKIEFYKKALIALVAFNVFCVFTGLYLFVIYITKEKDAHRQLENSTLTMEELRKHESALLKLQSEFHPGSQQFLFSFWSYQNLVKESPLLKDIPEFHQLTLTTPDKLNAKMFSDLLPKVSELRKKYIDDLLKAQQTGDSVKLNFLVVALVTFSFGFLLPVYIFSLITRKIDSLREQIVDKIQKILTAWQEQSQSFQQSDLTLWLYLFLLSVELVAPMSKNTTLQVGSELSYLLRQEIKRRNDRFNADSAA